MCLRRGFSKLYRIELLDSGHEEEVNFNFLVEFPYNLYLGREHWLTETILMTSVYLLGVFNEPSIALMGYQTRRRVGVDAEGIGWLV